MRRPGSGRRWRRRATWGPRARGGSGRGAGGTTSGGGGGRPCRRRRVGRRPRARTRTRRRRRAWTASWRRGSPPPRPWRTAARPWRGRRPRRAASARGCSLFFSPLLPRWREGSIAVAEATAANCSDLPSEVRRGRVRWPGCATRNRFVTSFLVVHSSGLPDDFKPSTFTGNGALKFKNEALLLKSFQNGLILGRFSISKMIFCKQLIDLFYFANR